MSQMTLACEADIPLKHLGLLETDRVAPTAEILLHLAECLNIPLRGKNALLIAAGHPPAFPHYNFHSPAMASARRNIEAMLAAHDPHPAFAIDRHWMVLSANAATATFVAGAEPILLRPPFNLLRLCLHPAGLASRIVNLGEWRSHISVRLRREIDETGDTDLVDLLEEIQDYPTPPFAPLSAGLIDMVPVATPLTLATIDGTLSFFNTTTRFGSATDITLSELAIESFLPTDAETADILLRNRTPPVRPEPAPARDEKRQVAWLA